MRNGKGLVRGEVYVQYKDSLRERCFLFLIAVFVLLFFSKCPFEPTTQVL